MNVAPQIICLCGCFIDWIVYFSSFLLPGGLLMFLLCKANYFRVDSSYDKILPQSSALRVTCCLANARDLDYITAVWRHLLEGLSNFRSKAKLRSYETHRTDICSSLKQSSVDLLTRICWWPCSNALHQTVISRNDFPCTSTSHRVSKYHMRY